jgi:HemY protein
MTRVLFYFVLLFLVAMGFAWLADRPGDLTLHWQSKTFEMSLLSAAVGLAVIVGMLALLFSIIRGIVTTPRIFGDFLGQRRRDRGYRALSRGMIAVGAGDTRLARRAAHESSGILKDEPLTLLLTAQAAQLAGDAAGARTAFEALAARPDTRVLGLHGLYIEATRQGEHEAARHFAEETTKAAPQIGWAGTALFDYQAGSGEWQGALATLDANLRAGILDKKRQKRLRAVLLTAIALESESGDPEGARARALEAHKLAPELPEAAIVAGRLLARAGDLRRASRVLESTWKIAPHPEVADAYSALRSGDSVRDRLKRVKRLADMQPGNPESAMAMARAAIDAHEWRMARDVLQKLLDTRPSERVCLLMAEIEEGESGDEGRVRQWLARAIHAPRDPVWVADGQIFPRWAPVSPVSGKIDRFEWKVAGEPIPAHRVPGIEAERRAATPSTELVPAPALAPERLPAAEPIEAIETVEPVPAESAPTPAPKKEPDKPREPAVPTPAPAAAAAPILAEPVLPHAPDDPGPEPAETDEARGRFRLF